MINFLKKISQTNKPQISTNTNRQKQIEIAGIVTDNESLELLKKATSFKKSDIERAIVLIRKSIEKYPALSSYFKLANYLTIANRAEEANETYLKLINQYKQNDNLFNFSNRFQIYEQYSNFLFKKFFYKEYIFYYCLSTYNELVAWSIENDDNIVKAILSGLKIKESFTDRKTNKAFSELHSSQNQALFIESFYKILVNFQFKTLSDLTYFLKYQKKDRLTLESVEKGSDWLLWSDQKFRNAILLFDEQIFIEVYKTKLEILLNLH